jgi:hypothetical protein
MRWAYASVFGLRIQVPWDDNQPQYGRYHYAYAKGTRQQIVAFTEGSCPAHNKWAIENWMKGHNSQDIHVGIDCSGFVYRVLDETMQSTGTGSLARTLGTACEYTPLDALTPAGQEIRRAMDVQAGDTMRFNRGRHSGVIIETVTDEWGTVREIWYAHSSFTRGPHIGWIEVGDPYQPIEARAQTWHDEMWDHLTNNNLRDLYFTSVHHSPFYRGPRPQVSKLLGVRVQVNGDPVVFSVQPFILGGRTMAQLRPLGEAMGAVVTWDGDAQRVTLNRGARTAICQVGTDVGIVGSQGYRLDEPPILVDENVVAPVRFLAEGLGFQVQWDPGARLVSLVG